MRLTAVDVVGGTARPAHRRKANNPTLERALLKLAERLFPPPEQGYRRGYVIEIEL